MNKKISPLLAISIIISCTWQFFGLFVYALVLDGGQRGLYAEFAFVCYWATVIFLLKYNKVLRTSHYIYIAFSYIFILWGTEYLNNYIFDYGKKYVYVVTVACVTLALLLFLQKKYSKDIIGQDGNANSSTDL